MKLFLSLLFFLASFQVKADALSDLALYYRCHAHMTQFRPFRDTRFSDVQNGIKDPIDACLEVLDLGRLNSGTGLMQNPGDFLGQQVLRRFHDLHASWFMIKRYPQIGPFEASQGTEDIYDTSEGALYLTRALLEDGIGIDYAVTSTDNLRAQRSITDPATSFITVLTKSDTIFGSNVVMASRGDLLGYMITGLLNFVYSYNDNSETLQTGSINAGQHYGGGLLGSPSYLLLNVDEDENFRSDGALEMPRKWARGVFKDLLCRDLPLVRSSDATAHVVPASSIPFRQSTSCTRCHVTMDQAAATIRGFRYESHGRGVAPLKIGGVFVNMESVTQPSETGWPAVTDPLYSFRPTKGKLYMRSYNGTLIDVDVNNVGELGTQIAATDDYYICMAKKYYKYFTGQDVNTGDLQDPENTITLSTEEQFHRDFVVQQGLSLRTHRNPRTLIENIVRSIQYRQTDFQNP